MSDTLTSSHATSSQASTSAVVALMTSMVEGTKKIRLALIEDERSNGGEEDDDSLHHANDSKFHRDEAFDHPQDTDLYWYERGEFREGNRCMQALSFMDRFVILESNCFRKVWELLLFIMLLYIGIVFPFRLAFVHFRLVGANEADCDPSEEGSGWEVLEQVVVVFFWIDLFLNFLLTYRKKDTEECRFVAILIHYMSGFFWVNLLACVPVETFEPIVQALDLDPGGCNLVGSNSSMIVEGGAKSNQVARLARLQRVTRLARLARLLRIFRIVTFLQKSAKAEIVRVLRTFRMVNWICCLSWVVHLLACGWYLCAAMHVDHEQTWVGRRVVNSDGDTLIAQGEWVQWAHAMYFILTVFTTVGFGDMSATTVGEIVYVAFVMMVGAVVHSIVISEMINLIGEVDEDTKWKRTQKKLLAAYGQHARLRRGTLDRLTNWVNSSQSQRSTYDRDEMRKLLTSGLMPRRILGEMSEQLFEGTLTRSRFMKACATGCQGGTPPPRFSLLLSTMLSPQSFEAEELVYQLHDHAFNMYFVMKGTYANVGEVCPDGGRDSILYGCDQGLTPDKRLPVSFTRSTTAGQLRQAMGSGKSITGISTVVVNPLESDRSYSSGSHCAYTNPNSLLGQDKSAWSVDAGRGQWLQLDLGQAKPVVGIVLQGHPRRDEWVTKCTVSVRSDDREDWKLVATSNTGCADRDTMVEIFFPEPYMGKSVRIEPREWVGSRISMRAGVSIFQNTLFPYQLFGKYDFFGEDISLEGTRSATMRCEVAGDVLLLHKQDLLHSYGRNSGSLLSEFPQFSRTLKNEFLRREARRKRMLKKLTKVQPYPAFINFAASSIQSSWRRHNRGSHSGSGSGLRSPWARPGASSFEGAVGLAAKSESARPDAENVRPTSAELWLDSPAQGSAHREQLETKVNGIIEDVEQLRREFGRKLDTVDAKIDTVNANLEALTAAVQKSLRS